MGLEQALADNTAAIRDLIAISTKLHDLRADVIEKVSGAAKTEKKTEKKTDEPKQNISTGGERVDPNDKPYEGIKELIAAYLGGTERPEEREARKEKVKALLNHEKIKKADVATATAVDHIKVESVALFKDQMAKLTAKGDLTTPAKSDDLDL